MRYVCVRVIIQGSNADGEYESIHDSRKRNERTFFRIYGWIIESVLRWYKPKGSGNYLCGYVRCKGDSLFVY